MTTAFALLGGAALGAVQVAMIGALVEAEVTPDLIGSTSVGAVNGGWTAGRPDTPGVADLPALWRALQRGDVFPPDCCRIVRGRPGSRSRSDSTAVSCDWNGHGQDKTLASSS